MTAADIEPAGTAILADGWGDRHAWFAYVVASPSAHGFVAEAADGTVVGTAVAAIHGPVAWIGTIWVHTPWRGRGLGAALTDLAVDAAERAGCTTQLLVATDAGRPLYERRGFEVQTWYRTMEAPGRRGPSPATVRAFTPGDLATMIALDRQATGEDRSIALGTFSQPTTARVLATTAIDGNEPVGRGDPAGRGETPGRGETATAVRGFVVRAPWGGGATVAGRVEDAMTLLQARLVAAGPDRTVRCGIVLDNEAGSAALEADGWTEAWRAPRLIRGAALDWTPTMLWGQFNHAMG
jgi:GNAT superfamily N-acetyltransferase